MYRRRITARTLGVAAGGLLGVAFLPVTMASADPVTYDYTNYDLTPVGSEVVSDGGIRNFLVEVPPAAEGSIQGTQDFTVTDPTTSAHLGTINADVNSTTDMFGNTNEMIYVTSDTSGAGDPPVGSLFDTYTYTSGFSAVYTDIPGAAKGGGDLITYSIDSPLYGDFNIPTSYDALAVVPVSAPGVGALSADTFVLAGSDTIEGVNGIPPADYDLLGTQGFSIMDGTTPDGTFTADFANSSDILGNTTQDLLVTSSDNSNLPVGSVIDYFFSDGSDTRYNVYSDIPTATGDKITDTIVTPYGSFNVPTTFDAAAGLAGILNGTTSLGQDIDVPKAFDITPEGPGSIVAIDGIQPEDIDVQGTQLFDWDDLATGQTGTFDADVAQSTIVFGNTTQDQYVVTSDVSGNAPPVNSVFEVYNYGNGWENVYSDIVGAGSGGADKITDTFVTPFGDFNIPDSYDASALLTGDSLAAAGASVGVTDVLSSLDPSSAVDAGTFADLFPHAADLLASLF
jgi:hypothetical protein